MKIITVEEMREMDRRAIHEYGIPSLALMENAGREVAQFILQLFPLSKNREILIVCGKGNNAGDGFVVARHLLESGFKVGVFLLQRLDAYEGDAKINLQRFTGDVQELLHERALRAFLEEARSADLIVDAIFGTGLNRAVEPWFAQVIRGINKLRAPILSVDIPSGLNGNTGEKMGEAILADYTCTFHLPKKGLLWGPDSACTGRLEVFPIGIPKSLESKIHRRLFYNFPGLFASRLLPRKKESHKNMYGHVLTVASSKNKMGAGLLTARAALRAGAGLSTLALPQCAYEKIDPRYAEIMFEPLASEGNYFSSSCLPSLKNIFKNKKSMACGPGMGQSQDLVELVKYLISNARVPLVLDADALNNLAAHKGVLLKRRSSIVLTPHPGEMARLCGLDKTTLLQNREEVLRAFAKKYSVSVVLKAYRSLIATAEGDLYINGTGNPGMATAGTGDVLTGVLAGLLAQSIPFDKAVLAGVWLHGRAGDRVADERGEAGMLAWDIAEKIPQALKEIQDVH